MSAERVEIVNRDRRAVEGMAENLRRAGWATSLLRREGDLWLFEMTRDGRPGGSAGGRAVRPQPVAARASPVCPCCGSVDYIEREEQVYCLVERWRECLNPRCAHREWEQRL